MPRYKDITGQRFGRLTAQYRQPWKRAGKSVWHCVCDCGNEVDVRLEMLTVPKGSQRSKTRSCGCLQAEYFVNPQNGVDYSQSYLGKVYNNIKIISPTGEKGRDRDLLHNCHCYNCGFDFIAPGSEVAKGYFLCPKCNS